MVSNTGRQVIPIAPFSKHYVNHHGHLQSFHINVKAGVFGYVDFPVSGPEILQPKLVFPEALKAAVGKVVSLIL